jgi:hypothetical protein
MLARCQFGIRDGRCGATLTYPIKGYPWRNILVKHYVFSLDPVTIDQLFAEVSRIRKESPEECLSADELWNDASEKANGITRDRLTGTLCYTIQIVAENALPEEQYSLRETSTVLIGSALFKVVANWIAPYENRPHRAHPA